MNATGIIGEEVTPILFEEMDGVYISMQGKDRPGKKKSKEMKVAVAYKGWENDGKGNTKLVGKIMTAEMENATEFLAIREAMLQNKYNADEIEECFNYIEAYATSVESPISTDKGSKKARELLEYFKNNQEGLIPYQRRGIKLPKEPQGIVYKNLGTQENHNCSVVTQRMKHRRMSWSITGANNIVKLLVRKENKTFIFIRRYI